MRWRKIGLVSDPVEVRSVVEEGLLRPLADVCKADRRFRKDQPLAVAEVLSLVRRAEERDDFLGRIRLVKLRLGHGPSWLAQWQWHISGSHAFRKTAFDEVGGEASRRSLATLARNWFQSALSSSAAFISCGT